MSYTDPKIFVADPMAFQKGFNEQFGKFLETQRKADEKAEKGLNDFTSGLYSSEAYTSADAEMRDVLSSYFKDKQQEYMSAKNDSEKNKIMADAMAEAGQFVNSYKLSNEARFNALSTSYLGKPIEELHFADPEEPITPTYQNGKFGISFKSDNGKQVFLSKEDLYKSKPPYANEVLENTQKRLQQSIDQFSKNNDGFDEEELNANREAEVNRFISKLNKDEIVSLMSTYDLSGPEELKAEISSQFGDNRAYARLQQEQRVVDRQIDAEQRKAKTSQQKVATDNKTTSQDIKEAAAAQVISEIENISSTEGFLKIGDIDVIETYENFWGKQKERVAGTKKGVLNMYEGDNFYEFSSKLNKVGFDVEVLAEEVASNEYENIGVEIRNVQTGKKMSVYDLENMSESDFVSILKKLSTTGTITGLMSQGNDEEDLPPIIIDEN